VADGRSRRLTVSDWVEAGFTLLAEEGVKALTLDRLCRRAGVTKGSFYWHFADLGAYRSALMDAWADLHDTERAELTAMTDREPREPLGRMMQVLLGERLWMLERAMREWARSDANAAAAVAAADRRVWRAVRQAYLDDGFTPQEAEVRADATFAVGVGILHLSASAPNAEAAGRFLDIMLRH
jgi:AcrR family transcriptional regulator